MDLKMVGIYGHKRTMSLGRLVVECMSKDGEMGLWPSAEQASAVQGNADEAMPMSAPYNFINKAYLDDKCLSFFTHLRAGRGYDFEFINPSMGPMVCLSVPMFNDHVHKVVRRYMGDRQFVIKQALSLYTVFVDAPDIIDSNRYHAALELMSEWDTDFADLLKAIRSPEPVDFSKGAGLEMVAKLEDQLVEINLLTWGLSVAIRQPFLFRRAALYYLMGYDDITEAIYTYEMGQCAVALGSTDKVTPILGESHQAFLELAKGIGSVLGVQWDTDKRPRRDWPQRHAERESK